MNDNTDTSTKKSNTLILGLAVLIALIVLIGLGGFLYLKPKTATKTATNSVKTATSPNKLPAHSGKMSPAPPITIFPTTPPIPPSVICYHFKNLDEALQHINIACILDLNGTSKGAVSDDIAKLTNLGELDLPNNNLTQFPTVIFHLQNLAKIDLSNNHITTIPQEIAGSDIVNTLQTLILTGNPIADKQTITTLLPNTKITF